MGGALGLLSLEIPGCSIACSDDSGCNVDASDSESASILSTAAGELASDRGVVVETLFSDEPNILLKKPLIIRR